MKDYVIGDIHFGWKSNSTEWLESQRRYVTEQIIPTIRDEKPDRVIFLGDIYEVRYSINHIIGIELRNIIRGIYDAYITDVPDGRLVFVAGNHDFFSEVRDYEKYNVYRVLFDDEFLNEHPRMKIVDIDPWLDNNTLFLPWFWTKETEGFDGLLYRYKFGYNPKSDVQCIYCHTDLSVWPGPRITALHGCPVYAGHIHYIYHDDISNLHNVGACCQFKFDDVNSPRYTYIIDDFEIVRKIENTTTFKFKKIYNDEIFSVTDETFDNSNVQICITNANYGLAKYREQLKFIKDKWVNNYIRIHTYEDESDDGTSYLPSAGARTNINEYIEKNIPTDLSGKYDIIKRKMMEGK